MTAYLVNKIEAKQFGKEEIQIVIENLYYHLNIVIFYKKY